MTVRSAARGVIDYREADRHSTAWWKKWRLLTDAMKEEDDRELYKRAFDFNLAIVSNSGVSPEDFKKVQETARKFYEDILGNLRPWAGKRAEQREGAAYEKFKQDWAQLHGFSLDDEEAVANWESQLQNVMDSKSADFEEKAKEAQRVQEEMLQRLDGILEKRRRQQRGTKK